MGMDDNGDLFWRKKKGGLLKGCRLLWIGGLGRLDLSFYVGIDGPRPGVPVEAFKLSRRMVSK